MPKIDTSPDKINDFIKRGVAEITTQDSVLAQLQSGEALRIKHGVDPSGQDLHLGHAAVYLKLRDLQEMGHKIVFMIGGFTGRFGDPTERAVVRTLKSKAETEANSQNYIQQISKILNIKELEIRTNAEWYDNMSAEELIKLLSNFTVDQVMERDMFRERKKKNEPIQLHEIIYPILQGYDSVMLESDLTVIGTDQIFNESFGRELQKKFGQKPQSIVAISLLKGLDGAYKMGKSLGNYISINESPENQFGKIMSIPDSLIIDYFTFLTRLPLTEIKEMEDALKDGTINPKNLKIKLAQEIVGFFHSRSAAAAATGNFDKVFSKKETPDDLIVVAVDAVSSSVIDLVVASGLVKSKTEARRLITDGAVDINSKTITNTEELVEIGAGVVVKVGKHRFVKIIKK